MRSNYFRVFNFSLLIKIGLTNLKLWYFNNFIFIINTIKILKQFRTPPRKKLLILVLGVESKKLKNGNQNMPSRLHICLFHHQKCELNLILCLPPDIVDSSKTR